MKALVCALIALALGGGSHAEEAAMLPRVNELLAAGTQTVRVVGFGDSITGVYYHTGGRRAWPEMLGVALQRLHPQARLEVINAGVSGGNTVTGLARLEGDALVHKPDLVVVMFGMNDVAGIPKDQYLANLREIATRCRGAGAEVVLCTPNSIYPEDAGRPVATLAEYAEGVRALAKELGAPLADNFAVYESIRARDPRVWMMLMSDAIHPNMRGHKVIAEEAARAITGRRVSLRDVGPPPDRLDHVMARLQARQPARVIAMPPYDEWIGPALKALDPTATVEVTEWEVAGQSVAQIEAEARARGWMGAAEGRPMAPRDLVIIAVPAAAPADSVEQYYRGYAWLLNWSLSFDHLAWDALVLLPSVADPDLDPAGQTAEALALEVARGQDLPYLTRQVNDHTPGPELFTRWAVGLGDAGPKGQ